MLALYGDSVASAPLRMLAEQPDARTAVESMMRAYADAIAEQRIFEATHDRVAEVQRTSQVRDAQTVGIARFFTPVVFGMSIQARDGVTRDEFDDVIACAMASWDALLSP